MFFFPTILPLSVRRKAKKCLSFSVDFTSICEKKSKKISFLPTWFYLYLFEEKHRNALLSHLFFYLYLWEEKQKYILPSHLILPLFVRGEAEKCFSFPLDVTSICESEMVVSAVGLTNLVSPAQSGTSHTPCFISTRYPLFVSCTPCLLRFHQCCGSGSGIRCLFRPLDPGWVKSQDPDPGWTTRILFQRARNHFFV